MSLVGTEDHHHVQRVHRFSLSDGRIIMHPVSVCILWTVQSSDTKFKPGPARMRTLPHCVGSMLKHATRSSGCWLRPTHKPPVRRDRDSHSARSSRTTHTHDASRIGKAGSRFCTMYQMNKYGACKTVAEARVRFFLPLAEILGPFNFWIRAGVASQQLRCG